MQDSVCFTSCNNTYLDRAAVLARSFKKHHQDWKFVVLLSDWDGDLDAIKARVPEIDEIFPICQMEETADPSWTYRHDPEELCTAVKPFFARHLLRQGFQRILFLDPDVVVLRPLHEVSDGLDEASFLLTPHVWAPSDNRRHIELHEISCLAHGIFNLGFFALRSSSEAEDVLEFWASRLKHYCYRDHGSGLFTDQKWVNFFPVFFDHVKIIKERTLNVSSWNLVNLNLSGSIPNLYSSEKRVGFVHFSGVSHDVFTWAAAEVGQLSNTVVSIFEWYKQALQGEKVHGFPAAQRYLRYESGREIRKAHRVHYRSNEAFSQKYPNPYDDLSPNSFYVREILSNEEELRSRHENPHFIVRRY